MHIAPLAVLRVAFGAVMLVSTIRFIGKGWVNSFYIQPKFHFTFFGFNWVEAPDATGMYLLFALMALAALLIAIGLWYRLAAVAFFITFTYIELIDKTTYLNHYYLVSIISFLLILVPANRYFSVDVWLRPRLKVNTVPGWCVNIFRLQLVLVYFFAGVAKLNHDWMINAMPLRIWLPASSQLWLIGPLLSKLWMAYAFSWIGALFDLLIGFLLLSKRYRGWAYLLVFIFHLVTGWFFKIGMFPYIMMVLTLVFFNGNTNQRIIGWLSRLLPAHKVNDAQETTLYQTKPLITKVIGAVLVVHFLLQLMIPFRYLLYPGKLYWTEEGYRFSWRVMLMEKGGTVFFHVKDPATGKSAEVVNSRYLNYFQETQMATQPDMILQFAHFLASEYAKKGIKAPVVTAESYVTLNGSGSQLYIDTTINLAKEQETLFGHNRWIHPFKDHH